MNTKILYAIFFFLLWGTTDNEVQGLLFSKFQNLVYRNLVEPLGQRTEASTYSTAQHKHRKTYTYIHVPSGIQTLISSNLVFEL
jgi:hypothetical protein